MSEYQYIAFRAIDRRVGESDLKYMRKQSSRARITGWSFDNEYHFGDFGGNALEMLRRGYDIHLHYANFGIRSLFLRFADGLPGAVTPYLTTDALRIKRDSKGKGAILCIEPCYEPGQLEDLWELEGYIERLVPLRDEIGGGDMRPLYLASLAVACDTEHDPDATLARPSPGGLGDLSRAQCALAEYFGIRESMIAAAAVESKALRTISNLSDTAALIERDAARRATERLNRARQKRLAQMAEDPQRTIRETERLVRQRTGEAYRQIGQMLAELREALAGTGHADLARDQARKLQSANPTLRLLTRELRKLELV